MLLVYSLFDRVGRPERRRPSKKTGNHPWTVVPPRPVLSRCIDVNHVPAPTPKDCRSWCRRHTQVVV